VQIDLVQSDDLRFTRWSYNADRTDLELGLKAAHRNELLMAVAKFIDRNVRLRTPTGEALAVERYRFDFNRGLMRYYEDRVGKTKTLKNFQVKTREFVTRDPDEIASRLFGAGVTGDRLTSFTDVLKLVLAPSFIGKPHLQDIIERCVTGLAQKKLMIPPVLMSVSLQKPSTRIIPLENRLVAR
jgi:hypothetical protein